MSNNDHTQIVRDFHQLSVRELMENTWDTPFIEKNADITNVFAVLSGKNHVWVVESNETMKLVGVITEHDGLILLLPAYVSTHAFSRPDLRSLQYGLIKTAEDIMSKNPIIASCEEKVKDILERMKHYKVRRLAVVNENGILLGEITLHQLIYKYYVELTKSIS